MANAKNEPVVKENYLADHDVYVNPEYTKEVDPGTDGAVLLAYRGQYVEHDGAVRLGLIKATKEEKASLQPASQGQATGAGAGASK